MRAFNFEYPRGREVVQILVFNGGQPFILDGRTDRPKIYSIEGWQTKEDLLEWARQNQARCVGFEGDYRLPSRSFVNRQTWAVV